LDFNGNPEAARLGSPNLEFKRFIIREHLPSAVQVRVG
jgi:hypothetical protein